MSAPVPLAPVPLALVLVALVLLAACAGVRRGRPGEVSPPAGEADGPAIFAPGVVSTAAPEFAVGFTPDGRTVYFGRASADRSSLTIMTSTWEGGRWSEPAVAPFSGRYRDVDPFVSPDGRRVYFSSDRPRAAARGRSLSTWYVERTAGGWGEPVDAGEPLNSDSADVFVSVARDGTVLFGSARDGRRRVYTTRESGGRWAVPRPVRFGAVEEAGNPLIAPSGRFVLLTMDRPGRRGDLFVSCRAGDGWGEPRPLADAVNSPYAELAPAVDPAETTLYFTSERPGLVGAVPDSVRPPGDLYRIPLRRAHVECR